VHWKVVIVRFQLTEGCLLGITTVNASCNYSRTHELQITLEASGIHCTASRNDIQSMAHVIQATLGALMSRLVVEGCPKSLEAQELHHQCGQNESIDIRKS
jgi:hypothetical protein